MSLSRIEQSGKRLLELINNLLDLSKLQANRVEYSFEENNLVDIVTVVVDELSSLTYGKGIQLDIKKSDVCTIVSCDKPSISRVFVNLISNAIKFTPEDKAISIEFSSSEQTMGGCRNRWIAGAPWLPSSSAPL